MTLPKQYDPHAHEPLIYQKWEESGAFQPDQTALDAGKPPFVIMLPPPNITGNLHMGHALQDTIMDILTRYHRMKGEPTLWLPGVDHAALPTNKIIEQQLHDEGKTRSDVGREEFQKRTEAWYAKTSAEILTQMKRLGSSCDWSRNRFTMDTEYYRAVQEAFIRYAEKGFIYRGARIVNWDPKTQTTVSDLEIEWKTERAPFYTFQYGPFEIGTARPETKFGDKYVVMHPEDARYAAYQHGDTFDCEWINGPVTATIIKDPVVDPAFGTGVMTITPWHDATDFDIAQRHNLDMEPVIDLEGKLLPSAGEFAGMTIHKARPLIIKKLEEKGLLIGVEEKYEHNVALNSRGQGVIEPQVMRQWFVDMQKLKGETMDVASEELVKFVPARWKKHFITWMEGVLDWNINRQIWLGHRIPVWWKPGVRGTDREDEDGSFVVSIEKPDGEWEQDPDVLDTWFSSALWPFATLGWPDNTKDLETFYPSAVLVTGRDILYLWVARMIFSGLEFMQGEGYGSRSQEQRIPFRDVFIHPTVLTKSGQRMSKSLGTGVDPLELIEKYGADATRFGLMYQMSFDTQAIKFDEEAIKTSRNFANKVWNIARLLETLPVREDRQVSDDWIAYRQQQVAFEVTTCIEQYKFGEAARILYDFVWKDYADWYLEIVKVSGSTVQAKQTFERTLQMLHPFMPHITEVLWEHLGKKELLIKGPWTDDATMKPVDATVMNRFQEIVNCVRSARVLLQIPPGEEVQVYVEHPPLPEALSALAHSQLLSSEKEHMKSFPLSTGESLKLSASSITPESLKRAQEKLLREQEKTSALIAQQEKILENMRGKAPEEKIVEKESIVSESRGHLQEIKRSLELLQ